MIELHIFTLTEEWCHLGGYDTYQTTWGGTLRELERVMKLKYEKKVYKIATTQVGMLSLKLFKYTTLRIFIHDEQGCYEIKHGKNEDLGISLHDGNNLMYFWLTGHFKPIKK